jgi:hypothetical protein
MWSSVTRLGDNVGSYEQTRVVSPQASSEPRGADDTSAAFYCCLCVEVGPDDALQYLGCGHCLCAVAVDAVLDIFSVQFDVSNLKSLTY